MYRNRIFQAGTAALAVALLGLLSLGATERRSGRPDCIRIGMVKSLFRDVSPSMMQVSLQPFSTIVRSQTGLDGRPVLGGTALDVARQLRDNEIQVGVFHGFEFAWAQEKYPELQPLVIAINEHRQLRAVLVTRKKDPAQGVEDFKGKKLALPQKSREHCHLFLEKLCRECGCGPKEFFGAIVTHPNCIAALDDVLRKKADAAVVDGVSLDYYRRAKPGCYAALKFVKQSPIFPAAVLAYRQGVLDAAILAQFRNGLIRASQNATTRDLMLLWRMTAFEAIPANYQQTLVNIRREYPCPEE